MYDRFLAARANVGEALFDVRMAARNFFTPRDYTREMFSTVSRLYVCWMIFLVGMNGTFGITKFAEGKWNEGFLYLLVAALFAIMFFNELMLNMAQRSIKLLLGVADDQHRVIEEMMAVGFGTDETGEFD